MRMSSLAIAALLSFALLLPGSMAAAQGFSVYGDTLVSIGLRFENDSNVLGTLGPFQGDLDSFMATDLYINFRQDERYDFLVDLRLAIDDPSAVGSPASIALTQCYFMIPFNVGQLYAGKRYREIGWSNFFNVVNRISPRSFSSLDFRGDPPAQLELCLSLYPFSFTALGWFEDAKDWQDVHWLASAAYLSGGISAELGAYLRAGEDLHGYASANYATGPLSFFIDGIIDDKAEQKIAAFDGYYSFLEPEDGVSWSLVAGIGYGSGAHSVKLEYLHRSQGYDAGQAVTFVSWVDSWGGGSGGPSGPAPMAEYRPFAFASDYAACNYDWTGIIIPELNLRATIAAGLPGLFVDSPLDWDASSCFASLRMSWTARQELVVGLSAAYRFGGPDGEFVAFSPSVAELTLDGRLSF